MIDETPASPAGRFFAARRVRGYLVIGPVPAFGTWWRPALRLAVALLAPFWIFSPLLALWLYVASNNGNEETLMPLLFGSASLSVAAGVYPLATWPCHWPFRFAAAFVWAMLLGAIGWPWTIFIVDTLNY